MVTDRYGSTSAARRRACRPSLRLRNCCSWRCCRFCHAIVHSTAIRLSTTPEFRPPSIVHEASGIPYLFLSSPLHSSLLSRVLSRMQWRAHTPTQATPGGFFFLDPCHHQRASSPNGLYLYKRFSLIQFFFLKKERFSSNRRMNVTAAIITDVDTSIR
jgi:hypothetical protein